ncbi:uncharacterized protein LOC110683884 [Chenopodium quinoa]|uniref:uncharacterized protein LOC110683884 n=1 Tax=Chenopodium quinoa TaxID=63459 RepID=UPI000B77DA85|nr:uncharacterized protein LOC110683884 [Chenopodium quinoa]
MPFDLLSRACEYFGPFGPNAQGIINLGISSISASSFFAVILFVSRYYQQQLPKDLFYWELKDPFNLSKGWILWTVIALDYIYVWCQFGYASMPNEETISKQWWYELLKSTNFSALCAFVCQGIIGPVVEEVLLCGFFLASLTKWVPTPVAVGISSAVSAIVQGNPNQYIIGFIVGSSYLQTRNLLTPIAIYCLYNTVLMSYYMVYISYLLSPL